jgi:glycosyltransferase involved in cell wall biosynthesis
MLLLPVPLGYSSAMPETIVVIPCYNEARRLDVDGLFRYAQTTSRLRFLLVDDGSTDGTLDLLNGLHRRDPFRFSVCAMPRNVGKGEAVRHGILRALDACPSFVAFWDADLATPLTALRQFREILSQRPECRLVLGSRVALLGRRVERKWSRHLMGRLFATAASATLGLRIYDTQCGAKMFRVSPGIEGVFRQPFRSRWIFDVELLARMTCLGWLQDVAPGRCAVYELPLDEWRDVSGSKLKATDFARAAWDLVTIYARYRYSSRRRMQPTSPRRDPLIPGSGFDPPGTSHGHAPPAEQRRAA